MKRVVNIAKSHREARNYDIRQAIEMTSVQRQEIAKKLKDKVYGYHTPDIKESRSYLSNQPLQANR